LDVVGFGHFQPTHLDVVGFGQCHPTHFEAVVVSTGVELVEDSVRLEVGVVDDDGTLEEDKTGGSHGSVDSKFFATYSDKRSGPPQYCVLFPVHGVLHCELSAGTVPFPSTTPQ
jgi:hypothetical protein